MNGHNSKNRPKWRRRASWGTRGAEAGIRKGPREDRAGDLWQAAKNNPYLSLALGPVAGWLTGWLLISASDTYTYTGTAVQYAIMLAVMLACVVRGAWLFGRRGPKKVRPTIGGKKQLLVALREVERPTCRR